MKKGDHKSIILLLAVSACVALAGVVLYAYGFFSVEEDQVVTDDQQTTASSTVASSKEDWKVFLPQLAPMIKAAFPDMFGVGAVSIDYAVDVTGDGVNEAFINTGADGAYTESLTVGILRNKKPELARFKEADGTIGPLLFTNGASVMHWETAVLDPATHTVSQQSIALKTDGPGLERCDITAYKWNEREHIFEFDAAESDRAESVTCPIKEAQANEIYRENIERR